MGWFRNWFDYFSQIGVPESNEPQIDEPIKFIISRMLREVDEVILKEDELRLLSNEELRNIINSILKPDVIVVGKSLEFTWRTGEEFEPLRIYQHKEDSWGADQLYHISGGIGLIDREVGVLLGRLGFDVEVSHSQANPHKPHNLSMSLITLKSYIHSERSSRRCEVWSKPGKGISNHEAAHLLNMASECVSHLGSYIALIRRLLQGRADALERSRLKEFRLSERDKLNEIYKPLMEEYYE